MAFFRAEISQKKRSKHLPRKAQTENSFGARFGRRNHDVAQRSEPPIDAGEQRKNDLFARQAH